MWSFLGSWKGLSSRPRVLGGPVRGSHVAQRGGCGRLAFFGVRRCLAPHVRYPFGPLLTLKRFVIRRRDEETIRSLLAFTPSFPTDRHTEEREGPAAKWALSLAQDPSRSRNAALLTLTTARPAGVNRQRASPVGSKSRALVPPRGVVKCPRGRCDKRPRIARPLRARNSRMALVGPNAS